MVILDEATSALDGISEKKILTNITNEMKERTIFNIAHRYSTVSASNFGLVLNDGKIAGFGTIGFLKNNNQVFQELFSSSLETGSLPSRKAS